ncbi:helix-turn-helix domain-containing protein [Sphaerisporangium rhizosphaerae]|uniref:Helix-turn-helix domain-containing protein n=1 Tax=Sphaerisporangium rhizosphaerae TaxID=2269375 RepID=A0ABW2P1N3_9ACTN
MEDERESTPDAEGPQGGMWHSGNSPEESIGRVLRELRKARGLSQEDVAKMMTMAGFSWRQTTVAKTEAAARPIRLDEAGALAFLFGLSINDMVGHASNTPREYRVESAYRVAFSMYLNTQLRVAEAKRRMEEADRDYRASLADLHALAGLYHEALQKFSEVFGEDLGELTERNLTEVKDRVAELWGNDGEHQEAP